MARQNKYKPIKEEDFWEARGRYDDMKQSGELYEKYPDMVGIWSYDMMKFLCDDDVLQEKEQEEEQKDQKPKGDSKSIWFDKKE